MQSQKQQNDLCFQGKPFNITVIQVYPLTSSAEEADVEWFHEDLPTRLSRTNTHTDTNGLLFILGDGNAKGGS